LNTQDNYGMTALHRAAKNVFGHLEVVRALIANGAEVNEVDKDVCTALHYAASDGRSDVIQELIAKGADVNLVESNGMTALHRAVICGHLGVVEVLIANRAELNLKDKNGKSALSYARYDAIAKALISAGAATEE
jgi:ankyrin repeat protein